MAYASVERLKRDHLTQLRGTSEFDSALERCLDDATSLIDKELGYSIAATATSSGKTVYGTGTAHLPLPEDYLSGTPVVTAPAGIDVPDYYVKVGDYLVITDEDGTLSGPYVTGGLAVASSGLVWDQDVKYTVTATYGSVPGLIARICCRIAHRFWETHGTTAGTITTETTQATFSYGLTEDEAKILAHYKPETAGVW